MALSYCVFCNSMGFSKGNHGFILRVQFHFVSKFHSLFGIIRVFFVQIQNEMRNSKVLLVSPYLRKKTYFLSEKTGLFLTVNWLTRNWLMWSEK